MAGTIDRATLDRLIASGRRQGSLTASEFQGALPIDGLEVDALVLLMLELEEAGVTVEPDAFGPRVEGGAVPILDLPPPKAEPPPPHSVAADGDGRPADTARIDPGTAPPSGGREGDDGVGRVVLLCGLALLLILGGILILI
ncbi:RNA polymerase sigma factor region1.1 domain-containing protein [Methylobacterium aerolatum]|uniref:RNA polymerase sigma factor 70 region 1.1 domain-containing protein n=1 Tax=Methylobacterium aerolatum TaxID=418708 RepID=A0ABU0I497_9HYPH|nr:RNA polymerase sigma factor region1.1 domain-containing protein [Methylobacterium aerolatum]MDQ0449434.1 hypothetical protein [Methylobacterium aerolatum]GJD37399.1 hypothetical protein FMGBMHLM_4329 [Methylobacterium aerolatum]